jgi:probable HAF family extracellular repeat protein
LSADGRVVAGASDVGGSLFVRYYAAFYWTEELGLVPIYGDPLLGISARAFAVNANGSALTGIADFGPFSEMGTQVFLWTPGGGTVLLGDIPGGLPQPQGHGHGVSDDGLHIAATGSSDRGVEAFRYSVSDGIFAAVGDLSGGSFGSYAHGISADGRVIVGVSYSSMDVQQAFRWTPEDGIQPLGFMPTPPGTTPYSYAFATNSDGTVIVGQGRTLASAPNANEAFRWTQAGGMQPLGDLPGGIYESRGYAVSADGSKVVGASMIEGPVGPFGGGSKPRAFLWDSQHGMRDLQVLLTTEFGIDLSGWDLREARGISADGRVIAGTGRHPDGTTEAWIVRLNPPPCPGDLNHDGSIGLGDLTLLLSHFGAPGGATADQGDLDGDGDVDLQDLTILLSVFDGWC